MNKKLVIVGALIVVFLLVSNSAKASKVPVNVAPKTTNFTPPTEEEIKDTLNNIARDNGIDMAKTVERIYRLETGHFKSGQFLSTGSPGMLMHNIDFPYGWNVCKQLWTNNENFAPVGNVDFTVGGKKYTYLVFPTFNAAAMSLVEYLKKYRPGRWFSKDDLGASNYEAKLNDITPKYVNG
jgi:hypothetical protein